MPEHSTVAALSSAYRGIGERTKPSPSNGKEQDWENLMSTVLPVSRDSTQSCSSDAKQPNACLCDPFQISQSPSAKWVKHHDNLVETAQAAPDDLDVLFVGDSIVEKWNGTKYLGRGLNTENREAFQRKFSKTHGAQLQGLALGASSDVAQALNWHIQNGVIAESLNAKVIWILIGTNNLPLECSTPENVASAILEVAFQIRKRKPNVKIVIQGLLPRGDVLGSLELRNTYKMIQKVNRQLASLCEKFPRLYYTEFDEVQLLTKAWDFTRMAWPWRRILNKQLMGDGTHPTAEGYELLGNYAESVIQNVLSVD